MTLSRASHREGKTSFLIKKWGNLLNISKFSAPEGLLEWIIDRIDPKLGEFRNPRNNTSILFTRQMVEKVLGLPVGTRPVVIISKHEELPHREFYKTEYEHGRRAPIHHAATILDKGNDLDDETFFRTFFLLALATHMAPGTGNMLPLEYLGSLEVADEVCEYAWGDLILKDVMSEIDTFQKKKKKALLDGVFKKIWVGSCLPLLAIIYMDHLDFPESSLSTHRINYSLPRASHVTDDDFDFVMLHDKSRLTLNPHLYGARPFRAPDTTPYAIQAANYKEQTAHQPYIQQTETDGTNHPAQDMHHQVPSLTMKQSEELPAFMLPILQRHNAKWAQDISKATSRLNKLHTKRMNEFAQDFLAATKNQTPIPPAYSSPPRVVQDSSTENDQENGTKTTPDTRFWQEATAYADEVDKSVGKTPHNNHVVASTSAPVTKKSTEEEDTRRRILASDEDLSYSFLPPGQTWTQVWSEPAPSSQQAQTVDAVTTVAQSSTPDIAGPTTMSTVDSNLPHIIHETSPLQIPPPTSTTQLNKENGTEAPSSICIVPEIQQRTAMDVPETIGTQTQEKKNRKKRACLRKTEDTRLKKLKVNTSSIDLYTKYITTRCLRPPTKKENRPPFVDYGGYHISYEDFREAMQPRGWIDTHTMELYIRQFNLEQSIETSGSALPTKYAFSQSLTSKLLVPEDKFVPTDCLREFNTAYQEGSLKSKDLLYFAIPHNQHWIVCCINLLYKQINIFDSGKKLNNDEVYDMSNNLVTNFATLAAHAKAFTKLDFMKFTCFNPPECPQQKTHFDCGIFTMLYMKQWDGKKMAEFCKDTYDHRALITEEILTSQLNTKDPSWVLKKK